MSVETGLYGVICLFILLALRVPVALALIAVSFGGVTLLLGVTPAIGILANTPFSFVSNWTLSAVPMFLLMGFVAYHAGLTTGLFEAAKAMLRRVPGALAISSIFACSGFAAVCGSSLATAAAMGRMAVPEMVRAGYSPSFATGAIAAGGTIGALIPPSILMIVYGVFAETSVIKVFMGGITIGLLTALLYSVVVLLMSWLRPDIAPPRPIDAANLSAVEAVGKIWPVLLLMVIVFGGLFSGIFTATEAGAVGAVGAIAIASATRRLSFRVFRSALLETLTTSASLFIIGIGAAMFTRFLGLTGLTGAISNLVSGAELGYFQLMLIVVLLYLVLGMFMEPFGALLVTLPVLLPIFRAEGIDLIWFGVLVVKLLEIGMITPPVGLNVFVIRNVASEYATVTQIFKGVIPFLLADVIVVAIAIVLPGLILFLPSLI
ncbi:TRAP transporter large permease [Marivita geojedonensis]|uniref:TRAP transporter large permease protein n=1 Tax=Marivita geojedonensis TaxID=1123756 RepID=A0A1X4NPH4_9RHOB|nr:TRAP transporter large permease subunit [Marivita geojedonensis]OSQ52653.1 C4-dicarboxylate ABC transporter [Marivita geojedonensis]PRY80863.1 tripartite ATP-independent transporter DctM subunit [Marivita geojedonensis]